jgi:hypothetical protein
MINSCEHMYVCLYISVVNTEPCQPRFCTGSNQGVQIWGFATDPIINVHSDEMLDPPTPQVDAQSLSAGRDCLFNVFTVTSHSWRPSSPSVTRQRNTSWQLGCPCHVDNFQYLRKRRSDRRTISRPRDINSSSRITWHAYNTWLKNLLYC